MTTEKRRLADFTYPSEEIQQDPYPFYEALRGECPVFHVPGRKAVQLSRYEDVNAAINEWRTISSDRSWLVSNISPEAAEILAEGWDELDVLLGEDPPSHKIHRRLVAPAFAPKRIEQLDARVRAMATQLIDEFADRGHADWVAEYANLLPSRVMTALFGVPFSDHERLAKYTEDYLDWTAKMLMPLTPEREVECAHSIVDFQRYVRDRLAEIEHDPGEDLFGDLVRADHVTLGVKIDVAKTMLLAGVETTRGLLGSALKHVLENAHVEKELRDQPDLISLAIDESLRLESPAQRVSRWLPGTAEVPAGQLPAEHYMNLLIGSANRDEDVFPNPDEFDLHRENLSKHLAFGRGTHFCIGSGLAKMEGIISIELAIERLPNLRLATTDTAYNKNPLTRALASLPIEWDTE